MAKNDGGLAKPHGDKVANQLIAFYETEFGGKKRGKYRVSTKNMMRIAGRRALRDVFLDEVAGELLERGFLLLDMRDTDAKSAFAVIAIRATDGWRSLSKKTIL